MSDKLQFVVLPAHIDKLKFVGHKLKFAGHPSRAEYFPSHDA
jgi:hypothetical protein